jgi:cytochrome P450
MTSTTSDLPVVPLRRAAQCPLAPPIEFESWREEPGLQRAMWNGQPTWIVSRYQDIRAALVDPRLSADTLPDIVGPSSEESTPVIFARIDDPEHHRLRRMMTGQFTFRRTEAMRPEIQKLVDHYLNKMIDAGPPADIVRDFALPVPSLVIALLLGVPPEDLELFQRSGLRGDV